MGSSTEWRDIKYMETFEQELRGLERRRASDPSLTLGDIEGTLKHMYIMDGANQDSMGVQDATVSATIAAYEHFIAEWQKVKT